MDLGLCYNSKTIKRKRGEAKGETAAFAWANVYWFDFATNRGAGGCTVSGYVVKCGYANAKRTSSQKIKLPNISN